MLTRRRIRLAHACAWLILFWTGCGEDDAPPPGLSTGNGPSGQDHGDGGALPMRSPRPDGGAILPAAEDEVVLEFGSAPALYSIEVDAEPGLLDVHLSIDTSGSIGGEINALQRDLGSVIGNLRARVADASFGVSRFEDFPEEPFGAPNDGETYAGDTPFRLLAPITSDETRIASAVASLDQPLGNGGDIPESSAEALWQVGTGAGYIARGESYIEPFAGRAAPGGGTAGGVGFREGALRVVLHVTDAPSHEPEDYGRRFPSTHDMQDAADALAGIGAKLVAIASGACLPDDGIEKCDRSLHDIARAELEQVALHTGSVVAASSDGYCPHGIDGQDLASVENVCPLVFDVSGAGTGLSETLTDAIVQLVDGVRFSAVTGEIGEDPLHFVQRVIPASAESEASGMGQAAEIADLLPADDPDGEPDSFVRVLGKARLRFDVELRNTRIAPSDVDQHFRVTVQISGDGLLLQEHTLRVVVPAGIGIAPAMPLDAGAVPSPGDDDAGS